MTDAATPETATAPESLDLHDAARAIEKLLRKDAASASPPTDRSGTASAAEREDDDDNDDGGIGVDAEGRDEEEPGEIEPGEQAGQPDEPRHRVKVDGESLEVPLSELIKGYQRGADYTRKTMRLADERREIDSLRERLGGELAAAQQERQHHAERLSGTIPSLRQQLAPFEGLDWARLSAENPGVYAQARPIYDTLLGHLQQAEAEQLHLQQAEQQHRQQQAQAHQEHLAAQKQALVARLPEMADPIAGRREAADLARYLSDAGYEAEEMARLVDHRDFILARKAMLYDRLMAARGKVKAKLDSLPRVQHPGTARGHREGSGERRVAMMRRLRQTGRTEDAARLIEALL